MPTCSKPRDYRHRANSYKLINVDGVLMVTIRIETHKPTTLRKLAAWLEKAARFMDGK